LYKIVSFFINDENEEHLELRFCGKIRHSGVYIAFSWKKSIIFLALLYQQKGT